MVWSEKTSGAVIGEKGMMGTHDMETYNRFKNTRWEYYLKNRLLETKFSRMGILRDSLRKIITKYFYYLLQGQLRAGSEGAGEERVHRLPAGKIFRFETNPYFLE